MGRTQSSGDEGGNNDDDDDQDPDKDEDDDDLEVSRPVNRAVISQVV